MSSISTSRPAPSGGGFQMPNLQMPQNMGTIVDKGSVIGQAGNALITGFQAAKTVGPDGATIIGDLRHFKFDGMFTAMKGLVTGSAQIAGKSGLIEGAISLVVNGYKAITKQESYSDAGAHVVGDGISGVVGGGVGAVASALGTGVLATFFGMGGGLLTIAGALIGMGGFYLGEKLFKSTSLYNRIYNGTKSLMTGSTSGFSNTAPAPAG